MNFFKRHYRGILVGILLAPPALVLLLAVLLYLPPIQQWATEIIERKVSEATGMDISVGKLRLGFPLSLTVQEVQAIQSNGDTMAKVGELRVDVALLPLLHKQVEVSGLGLFDASVNYTDSAGLLKLRAKVGELQTGPLALDLDEQKADLGRWLLRNTDFYFCSTDTVPDTTQTDKKPLKWFFTLSSLDIDCISARIELPFNQVYTSANIESGTISNVEGRLEDNLYTVGHARIQNAKGSYDRDLSKPKEPVVMDYGHIEVAGLDVELRDLLSQRTTLRLNLLSGSVRERSGLQIEQLKARYSMDSLGLAVRDMQLRTQHSLLSGSFEIPFDSFSAGKYKDSRVDLSASLSPKDIAHITGISLTQSVRKGQAAGYVGGNMGDEKLPDIKIVAKGRGGIDRIQVERLYVNWPGYADIRGKGEILHLQNHAKRGGQIDLNFLAHRNAQQLLAFAGPEVLQRYRLPDKTNLKATLSARGSRYAVQLQVRDEDRGLDLKGFYDLLSRKYELDAQTSSLNLMRYMPYDSIGFVDATIRAEGKDFDIFKKGTQAKLESRIDRLDYASYRFDSISIDAKLEEGALGASFASPNEGLSFGGILDVLISREEVSGGLMLKVDTIDLQTMRMTDSPLALSATLAAEFRSNLKETHTLSAILRDLRVSVGQDHLTPQEISLNLKTLPEHISAELMAGDLSVETNLNHGIDDLIKVLGHINDFVQQEISLAQMPEAYSHHSLDQLYTLLPNASVSLTMGQNNPLRDYLSYKGIYYKNASAAIFTGEQKGIEAIVDLVGFQQDTTRIDKILFLIGAGTSRGFFGPMESPLYMPAYHGSVEHLSRNGTEDLSDTVPAYPDFLDFKLLVKKQAYRSQKPFELSVGGRASLNALAVRAQMLDANKQPLHQLGMKAFVDSLGYGVHVEPYLGQLIIQKFPLTVNEGNVLYLYKGAKQLKADLEFLTKDRAALRLKTGPEERKEQEIRLSIERLGLPLLHFLPGMNTLGGMMFADLRLQTENISWDDMIGTGDISINQLSFEGREVGDLAMAMFYQPRNKQSHYVTADFSYNGNTALRFDGIYNLGGVKASSIQADVKFAEFPLTIANPILGAGATRLFGTINGNLDVDGPTDKPAIGGEVFFSSAGAHVPQLGTTIYTDSTALRFDHSTIFFDNYKFYTDANRREPLSVDGYFRLFGKPAMYTDLRIKANNLQIVNSKEAKEGDLLYGKLFMSTDLSLKGAVDKLKIRGKVDVLGNTNCTYIYTDSPLKPKDRMAGLVDFVDFSDSLYRPKAEMPELSLGRLDILLNLHIDPAVQVGVDLQAGHSDYVQLTGGGDLTFSYPPYGEMSLTGRYEISGGGTARYTLPVVGAKLFNVAPTSYISWSGNVADPYINFRAMQRIRADVVEEGSEKGRKVNFDVGIIAKENLSKLKLKFDLDAPEDLNMQTAIKSMGPEERGKQAIGLMATGMYLAGGGSSSNLTFDSAISALIQSELSSMTNKLLEGSDISIGMENREGASAAPSDITYTYSFSRRFFDDRIRLMVGGKVQTGANVTNREQTFIDNVTLEYRLDRAGSRYLSLFHHRNNDSMFEGEITETGASYLIRRKLMRLSNLFEFLRRKQESASTPTKQKSAISQSEE
ncbi:translocation/assembly module TamB domain-containing protein [Porphyromonas crevioricanis]|nr:translocation/assembly module TamB domain-containing protein [Porphyromonas crevioricanis]GAD06956.1 hypothetical protein PORCAN_567 [Porphyromonas crevioricanis JCM 13913]